MVTLQNWLLWVCLIQETIQLGNFYRDGFSKSQKRGKMKIIGNFCRDGFCKARKAKGKENYRLPMNPHV